ncbi:hypothetical protein BDV32DRAFT_143706 [Aspergillus pseudonomiae]|nr:hypothetical protein BDV32DRAFT_143706 [Aspergillus pseudonomiae]
MPLSLSGSWSEMKNITTYNIKAGIGKIEDILTADNITSLGTEDFEMPMGTLTLNIPPTFPARYVGDWVWQISGPDQKWTSCTTKTLLEFTFVKFGPPRGPIQPGNATTPARPDFGGEYPVDIFRLFLPKFPHHEISPPDYLKQTMDIIWNLGQNTNPNIAASRLFQYETIRGAPAYIDSGYGGTFQLRRFVSGLFDSLNCYDLAALSQLAICIIQDENGDEVYDSKWVICHPVDPQNPIPYGFIPDGPLIGWPQYPNCNSPFFSQNRLPHYNDPNDPSRQRFWNHAWVEVTNSGRRTVLDATHCLQSNPNPAAGEDDRSTYLKKNTDQTMPPNHPPQIRAFYQNPNVWDPPTYNQIGVTDVGSVPALSRAYGNPPSTTEWVPTRINNAPCDPSSILRVVQSIWPTANIDSADWLVASHGCQVLTAFSYIRNTNNRLFVEINNLETRSDANSQYQTLRANLQTLTEPGLHLPVTDIGDEAFRTPNNLIWRRNLMCIRIFAALPASDPQRPTEIPRLILETAKAVDGHLVASAVSPGQEARPSPTLRISTQRTLEIGRGRFDVLLDNVSDISDVSIAEIEDHTIVKQASIGSTLVGQHGIIRFVALKLGKTDVKICVAHHRSLAISTVNIEVIVSGHIECA